MDFFDIVKLLGGLAFFLFGMQTMSSGLEKMAGSKLEQMLRQMTDNPWKGIALGAGVTVAIQSSSALTVMLVGLVNSGIMEASQTTTAILGAHIGTTVTAWITSMSGIESENFFIQLLKPSTFAPLLALLGAFMMLLSKKKKRKDIGSILVGFGLLMTGMELMQEAMSPLADAGTFSSLLSVFDNPFLGLLLGVAFTGIIQSSAATIGILQALSMTGAISYRMAIPIVMGLNIGTCVTAVISSFGVSKEARKVSVIHILSNTIGAVICMLLFYGANAVFKFSFVEQKIDTFGIALVHTVFNIVTTIMWLPFLKPLEKLADLVVGDRKNVAAKASGKEVFLDERLLRSPSFALNECKQRMTEMASLACGGMLDAIRFMDRFDKEEAESIRAKEDQVDGYEDKLGSFLVKLSASSFSEHDSREISRMLHAISDFERISDHSVNIVEACEEMHNDDLSFTDEANSEIDVMQKALAEIVSIATDAYIQNDPALAAKVEPLEEVMDELTLKVRDNHIARLQKGSCSIHMGFILNDLLIDFERVSDHCSNIAAYVIELAQKGGNLDTHGFLNEVKKGGKEFQKMFAEYSEKYKI